jgi:hypothetical protein
MKKLTANSKSELTNRAKVVSNRRTTSYLDKLPGITEKMYDNLPDFKSTSSSFIDMSKPKKSLTSC